MKIFTIHNRTQSTIVGSHIEAAHSFFTRLVGLLGRRGLARDTGLWINPSSGVHTFAMRFPIDVVALDRQLRVHALWPNLRPWRLSGVSLKIHSILELPVGTIAERAIQLGDQLEVLPSPSAK